MPNVTMSQIAEVAGVSQATVSFVLNGRERSNGSISTETANRVQTVARELGYHPNRSARALATGRSNLVGLCMWNLAQAHYASVTRCVETELQHSENHLLVSCLHAGHTEDDPQLLQSTFPWPLDGVLALEAGTALDAHWKAFGRWPAPVVSMGGTHYKVDHLDYVGIDLAHGVKEAFSHLIEIGCRRIAFAAQQDSIENNELRLAAYAKALQEHGRKAEFIPLAANARHTTRQDVRAYVTAHGHPDGILCFNDEVALGVYRALCDLNIKVPQQVALVGCDGIEDTAYLETPLTTIVQPVQEMCRLAWEMLEARIHHPQKSFQQKVLLPQLAVRESTSYFGGNIK